MVNSDGTMPETAVMISYSWGRDDSPHMAYSPVDNAFGTADHFSHPLPAVPIAECVMVFPVLVHELETDMRGIGVQRLNSTHLIGESTSPLR